jgi:HAD superfamily hydrolase (TIGR01548 family)
MSDLLVFDMDGVLVDVTDSYREAIRETVRYFTGREITPEYIQDLKNQGGCNNDWELSHRIIGHCGIAVDYARVVEYFQSIFFGNGADGMILRERWIAGPGLLERLSLRFQLSIFTGRIKMEVDPTLKRFAAGLVFNPIVTTDDIANGKPAPDGLLHIASLHPGRKLWYVGDTVDDARSAKAAGITFIGIAAPTSPRHAALAALFKAENAVAVLEDINQLETVLR